ncbi:MAG TPA: efflux RND transporter periplasmic adaptor subunit [Parvibaculum sp.]|jgi:RND family efflux transporter MFP subunit
MQAPLPIRVAITLVALLFAIFAGYHLWTYYMSEPWTRDARVSADVVQIAPDVSGIVTAVSVTDNQLVHAGDILFVIDQARYQLALAQASATAESRQIQMAQLERDAKRKMELRSSAVSDSVREQAEAGAAAAAASYREARAALDVAKLDLERTTVRAPVNGHVTNLQLRKGDFGHAGTPLVAIVDADSFHINGYFEETKLPRIEDGARVSIHLMGVGTPLQGHVEGVARGIVDHELASSANMLANVNPTFSWVRLAQRIPVRIAIDGIPCGVRLAAGQTATVTLAPGAKSKSRDSVPLETSCR